MISLKSLGLLKYLFKCTLTVWLAKNKYDDRTTDRKTHFILQNGNFSFLRFLTGQEKFSKG